jgi:hypothetical protein
MILNKEKLHGALAMKRLACLTLALLAAAPPPARAKGTARCNVHGAWSFPRKAALPRGAAAALGFAMAERGAPWNPTDVLDSRRPLPSARFILARQRDCALAIRYEQGGIAHVRMTAILAWNGRVWVLARRQLR